MSESGDRGLVSQRHQPQYPDRRLAAVQQGRSALADLLPQR